MLDSFTVKRRKMSLGSWLLLFYILTCIGIFIWALEYALGIKK